MLLSSEFYMTISLETSIILSQTILQTYLSDHLWWPLFKISESGNEKIAFLENRICIKILKVAWSSAFTDYQEVRNSIFYDFLKIISAK